MQRRTVGGAAAGAWRYARRPMGQYSHVCDNDPEVIGQHVKRTPANSAHVGRTSAEWGPAQATRSSGRRVMRTGTSTWRRIPRRS